MVAATKQSRRFAQAGVPRRSTKALARELWPRGLAKSPCELVELLAAHAHAPVRADVLGALARLVLERERRLHGVIERVVLLGVASPVGQDVQHVAHAPGVARAQKRTPAAYTRAQLAVGLLVEATSG